jgi:hypothetical protein
MSPSPGRPFCRRLRGHILGPSRRDGNCRAGSTAAAAASVNVTVTARLGAAQAFPGPGPGPGPPLARLACHGAVVGSDLTESGAVPGQCAFRQVSMPGHGWALLMFRVSVHVP